MFQFYYRAYPFQGDISQVFLVYEALRDWKDWKQEEDWKSYYQIYCHLCGEQFRLWKDFY